jgi:hypothetical protein
VTGFLISYHADVSPGGCIIHAQAAFSFVSLRVAPQYGIIARKMKG